MSRPPPFPLFSPRLLYVANARNGRACVTSGPEMALISVARLTAGALFPSIFFCVLSKCYATRYLLHHSWLTFIIDFEPSHKLHTCEFFCLGGCVPSMLPSFSACVQPCAFVIGLSLSQGLS